MRKTFQPFGRRKYPPLDQGKPPVPEKLDLPTILLRLAGIAQAQRI